MKSNSFFDFKISDQKLTISFYGEMNKDNAHLLLNKRFSVKGIKSVAIDLLNLKKIDTAGAMALLYIENFFKNNNIPVVFEGADENISKIISLCKEYDYTGQPPKEDILWLQKLLYELGVFSINSISTFVSMLSFIGGSIVSFFKSFFRIRNIRFKATLYHLQHNCVFATPIIIITSLLIGVVLAYQGAIQLRQVGANIFIVEMIGISATREIAPLIAAIIIAGRSSSSFTAQIGVMKLTEEIDAMNTMGFSPWEFVILPRIIALMISLPLLVIIADIISVYGGMLIASLELNISYVEFLNRFRMKVDMKHIIIGLLKAPVFGIIIGLIGCFRGFEVEMNTESVGKYTTISVVNSIFWVIAFDALFSIILTKLHL
jgi:phospholipid/cholesterol/gamma-HCH transport system permease protein